MRSLVVLVGLLPFALPVSGQRAALISTDADAAECRHPSAPEIPIADTPIAGREAKKLNRDVADFIEDSAKYISCLRTDDSIDPATIGDKEALAIKGVADIVTLYETRVGHSEELTESIMKLAGPASGSTRASRIAHAERLAAQAQRYTSEAMLAIQVAIAHAKARRLAEARATLGQLDLETLTPYERSRAEWVLYAVAYAEEDFTEAREHVLKSLEAGGLSPSTRLTAQLALADLDVMLRLSDTTHDRVAEQSGD
jgi:tetratricopeptide (TPR) repeat protein